MKKRLLIPLGIFAVLVAAAFLTVTDGLSEGAKLSIQSVDLTSIPDGSYTGTYEFKRWTNTVTVHIRDHKIEGIDIDEDVRGADITGCSGEMIRRVVEAQDTAVDAVSGATVTSKAYLKAIENALSR